MLFRKDDVGLMLILLVVFNVFISCLADASSVSLGLSLAVCFLCSALCLILFLLVSHFILWHCS